MAERFNLEDFMNATDVPAQSKEQAKRVKEYFNRGGALVVDMFDEHDDIPVKERTGIYDAAHALEELTGVAPVIRPYSEISTTDVDKHPLMYIPGKHANFGDYISKRDFERFKPLSKKIRDSKVPIIGSCGGHQLIGLAYDGTIGKVAGSVHNTAEQPRVEGWMDPNPDNEGILNPDHPLFKEYLKTDGVVHHNHQEFVKGMDNRIAVLAESSINGQAIPYVMESTIPEKHIISFQYHPHRDPRHNLPDGSHFSGLVLLVSALDLLLPNSSNYTLKKKELYAL
jgi:gamma-glutamyl-gamma-aminobutyrate hydrolase PuuD